MVKWAWQDNCSSKPCISWTKLWFSHCCMRHGQLDPSFLFHPLYNNQVIKLITIISLIFNLMSSSITPVHLILAWSCGLLKSRKLWVHQIMKQPAILWFCFCAGDGGRRIQRIFKASNVWTGYLWSNRSNLDCVQQIIKSLTKTVVKYKHSQDSSLRDIHCRFSCSGTNSGAGNICSMVNIL